MQINLDQFCLGFLSVPRGFWKDTPFESLVQSKRRATLLLKWAENWLAEHGKESPVRFQLHLGIFVKGVLFFSDLFTASLRLLRLVFVDEVLFVLEFRLLSTRHLEEEVGF